MGKMLSIDEIRSKGYAWPKYDLIQEKCVAEGGKVDLSNTIERLKSSRAYFQQEIDQASAFKWRTGADYPDFTDMFDEYVRLKGESENAIAYLEKIGRAFGG